MADLQKCHIMGMGEKTPKYTKDETKGKNSPFGCPLTHTHTPFTKWRPTVFRYPKTNRTNPKWERVPKL